MMWQNKSGCNVKNKNGKNVLEKPHDTVERNVISVPTFEPY